jgi:type IX secretion system substrate protein
MLRLIPILLLLVSVFQSDTKAQVTFQNIYGTPGDDYVHAIVPTKDKGVLIIGRTDYFSGFYNTLLIKVNQYGSFEWSKTLNDKNGYTFNFGSDGFQESNGTFVITGRNTSGADQNYFVYKLDPNGNLTLHKSVLGDGNEYGRIIQPFQNKYAIVGFTSSSQIGHGANDIMISIVDKGGNNVKTYAYGDVGNDFGQGFVVGQDNSFIVSGYKRNYSGPYRATLLKTDFNGTIKWSFDYLSAYGNTTFKEIMPISNNNTMLTGWSESSRNDKDILICQADSKGNIVWAKNYGGTGEDIPFSITKTSDMGYVVVAVTRSYGSENQKILLFKIDSIGNVKWSRIYSGPDEDFLFTSRHIIHETSDGGFVFAYQSKNSRIDDYNIVLVKTDSLGRTPNCDYSDVVLNNSTITLTKSVWNLKVNSTVWTGSVSHNDTKRIMTQTKNCCSDVYSRMLDTVICFNDTITLTASAGMNYSWSPSNLVSCDTCRVVTVSPQNDTFIVSTTTTLDSCLIVDTFYIRVNAMPMVNPELNTRNCIDCTSIDLGKSPNSTGLNPYTWPSNTRSKATIIASGSFIQNDDGQYEYSVMIDSNGCNNVILNVKKVQGIDGGLTVYPNPARNAITIISEDLENSLIEFNDISGKILLKETIMSKSQVIDISMLPQGLYIMNVISDGILIKKMKIIVQ